MFVINKGAMTEQNRGSKQSEYEDYAIATIISRMLEDNTVKNFEVLMKPNRKLTLNVESDSGLCKYILFFLNETGDSNFDIDDYYQWYQDNRGDYKLLVVTNTKFTTIKTRMGDKSEATIVESEIPFFTNKNCYQLQSTTRNHFFQSFYFCTDFQPSTDSTVEKYVHFIQKQNPLQFNQQEIILYLLTNTPTPLLHPSKHGNLKTVTLLLEAGADINATSTNGYDWTPLHYACRHGHEDIVHLLVRRGANINAPDVKDRTPLHYASTYSWEKIVEYLIEQGAEVDCMDYYKWTPFHWACRYEHDEIVNLLSAANANINNVDVEGRTPLHWAALHGNAGVVDFLVKKGVDVDAIDGKGCTALQLAVEYGQESVVEFLNKLKEQK